MFDDHIAKPGSQGVPPSNLPIGEPEDMFSRTEHEVESVLDGAQQPGSAPLPPQEQRPASAVQAGILRPASSTSQEPQVTTMPQGVREEFVESQGGAPRESVAPQYQSQDPTYTMYAPHSSGKGKIVFLIIIILALLGGVSWVAYSKFIAPQDDEGLAPQPVQSEESTLEDTVPSDTEEDTNEPLDTNVVDDSLLFGQPIDEDGDGLDDERESTIGTDEKNWDTDGDELSDGDEVIIWKTNPLNPDSDNDTYKDGAEVRAGYSPSGSGRLFEPPATTTTP